MIYIDRNSTNKVVLTLTETVTLTPPYYFIFSFQHYATLTDLEAIIYFIAPDDSMYTDRYNLFEITESDTGSPTGGNDIPIYLKPGQYEYKVYQSTTNTIHSVSEDDLLETGKMIVGDMTEPGQDTAVASVYQ